MDRNLFDHHSCFVRASFSVIANKAAILSNRSRWTARMKFRF
jgi:hypothetical protein